MSKQGSSRLNNEIQDCWSADVAGDKTRRHRKDQKGAKRKRSREEDSREEEDSDEQQRREDEEYDRRQNPGKFEKWDRAAQQSSSAKRRNTGSKAKEQRRNSKAKQDKVDEQLARMEKIMNACIASGQLPVAPVAVRASAETPKHKCTQGKNDDGKELGKKISHCHRQKESAEQQRRREEKRVKTLAKAITMSAWLFGGTLQLFDINLNSDHNNFSQLDVNVRCEINNTGTVRGGVGRRERRQVGLHARTRQHQAGAAQHATRSGGRERNKKLVCTSGLVSI